MSTPRFSPSNNYDRDELLTAITDRTTPEQARTGHIIERHKRPVGECHLDKRIYERAVYADLAAMSRRLGVVDVKAEQRAAEPVDRCTWCNPAACMLPRCQEMATPAGDSTPTVPTRRVRRLPTLPWWRRLALRWLGR